MSKAIPPETKNRNRIKNMKTYSIETASIKATPIGTLRNGASPKGHILSMAFRKGTRIFLYTPDGVCREECEVNSARGNQITAEHAQSFSAAA